MVIAVMPESSDKPPAAVICYYTMTKRNGRLILLLVLLALAVSPPALVAAGPPLPAGPEIRVNRGEAGLFCNPQVAVFPDGGFVVVWTAAPDGTDPSTCFYGLANSVLHARLFAADGSPTSGELRLVRPFGPQLAGSVAALADGSFLVAYQQANARGRSIVMAARFGPDGAAILPPFRVHAASSLSRFSGLVAAAPEGGGFAVAWTAVALDDPRDPYGHQDAYARRFDAAGVPLGPEIRVAKGYSEAGGLDETSSAVAVAPDGSFWVATTNLGDDDTVSAAQFDATGRELSSVQGKQGGPQTDATLSVAADGSLVFAWTQGFCGFPVGVPVAVWARRLGADGAPLDSGPIQLNRRGPCEVQPQVAAFPGGSFVALWTDRAGRDGSGAGIFGRAFGADGTPQTRDFRVNVTTEGDQELSAIAANAKGDVVAVWTQSANPAHIVARRLGQPGG
jgi:hypothetical protein